MERVRPAWKSLCGSASCWEKPGAWVCDDQGKETRSCRVSRWLQALRCPPLSVPLSASCPRAGLPGAQK